MQLTAETGRMSGLDEAAMLSGRVLVYAGHTSTAQDLCGLIMRLGFDTSVAQSAEETFDELSRDRFDVCLIDDDQSPDVAADLSARLNESQLPTQLVRLINLDGAESPSADLRMAGSVPKSSPVLLQAALSAAVERAKLLTENRRLRRQLSSRLLFELVGSSPEMQALREQVLSVAASSMPVLITGEPGTGTNLVAHGIHIAGRRSFRPFVRLDCRLLSAESIEAKLFADSEDGDEAACSLDYQLAEGGTLFLDNIDALPQPTQKKLAAALETLRQDWSTPSREMYVVRIVTATHADLESNPDRFRGELFELLSASRIETPALRVRKNDISQLTEHFLNGLVAREGRPPRRVTIDALRLLEDYNWPGNVRELQNVVERACSLDLGSRLTVEMVRPWLAGGAADNTALPMTLKEMERKLIEATFSRYEGNRERTAQALQIGLRTLSGKLREYGYPPRGGPGSNIPESH